jgi:hypothetical protein
MYIYIYMYNIYIYIYSGMTAHELAREFAAARRARGTASVGAGGGGVGETGGVREVEGG